MPNFSLGGPTVRALNQGYGDTHTQHPPTHTHINTHTLTHVHFKIVQKQKEGTYLNSDPGSVFGGVKAGIVRSVF